ncbi:hypothetical protein COCOR_06224 [Corallococcus coralloides DSM 2259]|uniref:Uncharacterized protein n=1 Tax=Corallococcus coralloides (strain ATCC 25202 / DSM 2259 / NBRC 100086 / M2) TaxID=1144275 RepID=H8MNU3_CORCM|nr:hypothetical protein [Corallococcus coralloides]AFE06819.1 hypothetical protein COCOR_06224 [Corallococcus coralloides DSM 2259]
MSVDLDRLMRQYRECARHVWNTYFQPLPEGWHEFIDVEHALFQGLVLVQAGMNLSATESFALMEAIRVRPCFPPVGHLEVFHAKTPTPKVREVQWQQGRLSPGALDLRFLGFFDWANQDDPQDYRFVRARVFATEQPELEGCDVLLEFPAVTFEDARR